MASLSSAGAASDRSARSHTALCAYGFAFWDTDPVRALEALRRGFLVAHDSGNRANETNLASNLSRLEAEHADLLAALDYLKLAIRNYHDSGNTTSFRSPLAVLAYNQIDQARTGLDHRD